MSETPIPTSWPPPEQAYATAPSILSEIGWTVRAAADIECFGELEREYYLRKAALLDRIALLDDPGMADGGDATDTALAAALMLLDTDRTGMDPRLADLAESDPRGYVRQQYAAQLDLSDPMK
ncbi:hypothetical protein ACIO13_35685, partial [Streptomyces sp. NPDC087425]